MAHVSLLYEPLGEVRREDGAVWFASGGDAPHENGVLRAGDPSRDPGTSIDRLLRPFRDRRLPMMWWVFEPPTRRARELEAALRSRGLELASDLPGMALDLRRLRMPPSPAEATVERVVDPEGLALWADIVGRAFGSDDYAQGRSVRGFAAWGFADAAPFRHFLCRLADEWVGASTLSLGGGVAGLANIATLPHARRLGVGTAVAAAALREGASLGLRTAVLSAEELGRPMYERLGFREVSRHQTYVWQPG